MNRFKVMSASLLLSAVVSLGSLVILGSASSFAQSYNFTFTSGGISTHGIFNVTSGVVSSISGTVSGESSGNGAITALLAPGVYGGNDNVMQYPVTPYVDSNGVSFDVGSVDYNLFRFGASNYDLGSSVTGGVVGTLSVSPAGAPGPLAGSGIWSFLGLGFAGLFYKRKAFWRSTREVLGLSAP